MSSYRLANAGRAQEWREGTAVQKWEECANLSTQALVQICKLVHVNIPAVHTPRETKSKATAMGGDTKMKGEVRKHEIWVKEKENMWFWSCKHEEKWWMTTAKQSEKVQEETNWNGYACHPDDESQHAPFTFHSVIMQGVCLIYPLYLAAMSSSSPPQPQYWLGKPFIFMYWSGVTADTPPKYCGYGSLGGSHHAHSWK